MLCLKTPLSFPSRRDLILESGNVQAQLSFKLASKAKKTGSDTARAAIEWRLLEEGFNRAVAEAYRDGMKRLWRIVAPVRPLRKPGGVITIKYPSILALAGIGIEAAEDPDWTLRLGDREAAVAARHGCRAEEGYPEWLDALAISWPKQVRPVIKEQIEREWASPAETSTPFLYRYGVPTYSIQQPAQRLVLAAILKADAKTVAVPHRFKDHSQSRCELSGGCPFGPDRGS